MSEENASHVVHRNEPDPPSVQVKLGLSAAGKLMYEINVHAPSVAEALAMLDETSLELKNRGIQPPGVPDLEAQLEASIAAKTATNP